MTTGFRSFHRYILILFLLSLLQGCDRSVERETTNPDEILELNAYTDLQGSRFIINHQMERVAGFIKTVGIADELRFLDSLYQQDALFYPVIKRVDDCRSSLAKDLEKIISEQNSNDISLTFPAIRNVQKNIDTLISECQTLDQTLKAHSDKVSGKYSEIKTYGWVMSNPTELRRRLIQKSGWDCLKELCLLEQHFFLLKEQIHPKTAEVCGPWESLVFRISTAETYYQVGKPIHLKGELVVPINNKLELEIKDPYHPGKTLIASGKNNANAVIIPTKEGLQTIEGVIYRRNPRTKEYQKYPIRHTIYVQPTSKK